jgi:hypothetical protein
VPDGGAKEVDPTVLASLGEGKVDVWRVGLVYDIGAIGAI